MELREISVEDVYPDDKNPRNDFGDIVALAESCMLNALNPGEPVNPIVVVADGGIYRIIDGERRYKAINRNGLKRCHAVVCEDVDEANAMVAMLATDDKRQLSDIERSRGVQQMLLLGVDPEKVERAGRMAKGSAARIRRARAAVDDAGDDMTLDRMLAIAEFEEAGDAEAVERLASCRESEWPQVAASIRNERLRSEAFAELEDACDGLGIELSDEAPDWGSGTGMQWGCLSKDAESLASAVETAPDGAVWFIRDNYYEGPHVVRIDPKGSDGLDPEEAERKERVAHVKAAMEAAHVSRTSWFNERIGNLGSIPHVMSFIEKNAMNGGVGNNVEQYEQAVGIEVSREFCQMLAVHGYVNACTRMEMNDWMAQFLAVGNASYYGEQIDEHLKWIAAFEADGYESTEADLELKLMCEVALANGNEE